LYSGGDGGIRRWDLERGTQQLIFPSRPGSFMRLWMASNGRRALAREFDSVTRACGPVQVLDLEAATSSPGPALSGCQDIALDPTGSVAVAGDQNGTLWVGPVGGAMHLLPGHEGAIEQVAVSPDLRWVASTGEDNTLRLWPMPDLSKPPLHTLPLDQLLAKLRSLTNLRAVRDPAATGGWKIELAPFPGWKDVPTW
jgi:WD40 repeat protein